MRETTRAAQSAQDLLRSLSEYRSRFAEAAEAYDGSTAGAAELEALMADYARLVTDERRQPALDELERAAPAGFPELVLDLRRRSARCAAVTEKHRALNLLDGRSGTAGYFADVEACIEREFGAFRLDASSEVLLVGSGSFPMTLLNLARRTGARVVGVDIDAEAVDLGRQVVQLLGADLDITLEHATVTASPFTRQASHVIFSSTVEVKYELLHALHPLTRDEVVVAMRFGNHLKSLFNYPMQQVDPRRWELREVVHRPEHVFDVALYRKARAPRQVREVRGG